jgi:hypothetical protein
MLLSHPDRALLDEYSGKAGAIIKKESRTARKAHPDAHHNNMQTLLRSHWMSHHATRGADILVNPDDGKCKIAVGARGFAQAVMT